MKKLLALVLAVAMVLSTAVVFASAAEEEPEGYFWLKGTGDADPGINFKVPGDVLVDDNITIEALVMFDEDCVASGGCVYLNCYSYEKDEYNNWDYLISFIDYAKESSFTLGEWSKATFTFNPFDGAYGGHAGSKYTPAMLTMGIGFWQATGTVKVAYISVSQNGEEVWSIDFTAGFDPTRNSDLEKVVEGGIFNIDADGKDVKWGTVGAAVVVDDPAETDDTADDTGDDATDDSADDTGDDTGDPTSDAEPAAIAPTTVGFMTFTPDNTAYAVGDEITVNVSMTETAIKSLGILIKDMKGLEFVSGKWTKSAFTFEGEDDDIEPILMSNMKANGDAIDAAALAYSAENGEQKVSGDVFTLKLKVTDAQFALKIDVSYSGNDNAVNKLEDNDILNAAGGAEPVEPDEPGEPSSQPAEPAHTGDAGLIALAIVSVLALGGAVVVKKSK